MIVKLFVEDDGMGGIITVRVGGNKEMPAFMVGSALTNIVDQYASAVAQLIADTLSGMGKMQLTQEEMKDFGDRLTLKDLEPYLLAQSQPVEPKQRKEDGD